MTQPCNSIATSFDYAVPIEKQPLIAAAGLTDLSLGAAEAHSGDLSIPKSAPFYVPWRNRWDWASTPYTAPGPTGPTVLPSAIGLSLYMLGSSTFGARLAALLGLPFAFASDAFRRPSPLTGASSAHRRNWSKPYGIAGVNVIAANTSAAAEQQHLAARRNRVTAMLGRGRTFTE